jgi:ABC-type Mn2+/Zn2+ transport system permease subunit
MHRAVVGFLVSYYLDPPTGACSVIVSAIVFAVSASYKTLGSWHFDKPAAPKTQKNAALH